MSLVNEAIKDGAIPEGYAEVVVEFFQFKNEGDQLEGRLVNKAQTQVRGNKIGKYTIMKAGKRIAFLGGVQLDELLANVPLGSEVFIQYTHKEKTSESGNEIHRFKVFTKVTQA